MRKNLKSLIFFFCYAVLIADVTFRYAYGINEVVHSLLNFVVMPLLGILIVDNLNGLSLKRILILLSIIFIGVATRFISNDNTIMLAVLFICAFKDIDLDSLIRFNIPVRIVCMVILIVLFNLGLTESETYSRIDGVTRYAYGFGNINNLSTYILSIVLQVVYLDRKKIKLRDITIVSIGLVAIFVLTASRTHLAILILVLVLLIVTFAKSKSREIKVRNKFLKFFIVHSFIIMALLSLVTYIAYINGGSYAEEINMLTSKRVSTVKTLVDMNGVALFGQEVNRLSANGGQRVLDNSYAYLLLYFGPIILTGIAYIYKKGIRYFFNEKDDTGAVFVGLYNVAGLMEHFSVETSMNIFLLCFSNLIYKTPDAEKEKKKCLKK